MEQKRVGRQRKMKQKEKTEKRKKRWKERVYKCTRLKTKSKKRPLKDDPRDE